MKKDESTMIKGMWSIRALHECLLTILYDDHTWERYRFQVENNHHKEFKHVFNVRSMETNHFTKEEVFNLIKEKSPYPFEVEK